MSKGVAKAYVGYHAKRDGRVDLEDLVLMCRYWQYEIPQP